MRYTLKSLGMAVAGALALAGCDRVGGGWQTNYGDVVDTQAARGWNVVEVDVTVPRSLSVSEANTYAPNADIVWRGDPKGDRYAQIDRLITQAAQQGVSGLRGARPVRLDITLATFHALTEKARYGLNNSGVHNISFTAQVLDARTDEPLTVVDTINADLIAYVGDQALEAEARGETQRVRISRHVSKVIAGWLGTGPDVRGQFTRNGR